MRLQRRYLKGLINDIDDVDDEYWLIRDAVDAVDVYIDCKQGSTLQSVQSLVSISHANSDMVNHHFFSKFWDSETYIAMAIVSKEDWYPLR